MYSVLYRWELPICNMRLSAWFCIVCILTTGKEDKNTYIGNQLFSSYIEWNIHILLLEAVAGYHTTCIYQNLFLFILKENLNFEDVCSRTGNRMILGVTCITLHSYFEAYLSCKAVRPPLHRKLDIKAWSIVSAKEMKLQLSRTIRYVFLYLFWWWYKMLLMAMFDLLFASSVYECLIHRALCSSYICLCCLCNIW